MADFGGKARQILENFGKLVQIILDTPGSCAAPRNSGALALTKKPLDIFCRTLYNVYIN